MQKIKWGIISTGNIANQFASDFKYVKNGELVAVASRDINKASEFAKSHGIPKHYGSYDELFNDEEIQVVYIATPHNSHKKYSIQALKSGKAVLCEKPVTISLAEFEEVRNVAKKTGCYLMEGMWTYFLPAIQRAKNWVDQGRIGRIKHIKANFGFPAPYNPKGRLFNPELAGGSVLDVGIYPIAISWLMLGEEPDKITVKASKASTGVDDDVLMNFEYEDCVAMLHSSIRYKLFNHAIIIGEEGYIQIPDFWKASECCLFKGKADELIDSFKDERASIGFNYEIEAVNKDLKDKLQESTTMPLRFSEKLQDHMQRVMEQFEG